MLGWAVYRASFKVLSAAFDWQVSPAVTNLFCIQAERGPDGQPGLLGAPVSHLRSDFPLRPECMGQLVPQSINMWMGAASEGDTLL